MNETSFIKNIYKQNNTTERDNKLITTINQCFTNQIYKTGIICFIVFILYVLVEFGYGVFFQDSWEDDQFFIN